MKLGTDIHGPQMGKPADFNDPLTFPLATLLGFASLLYVKCLSK